MKVDFKLFHFETIKYISVSFYVFIKNLLNVFSSIISRSFVPVTVSACWTASGAQSTVTARLIWTSHIVRCRKSVSGASLVQRVPMQTASDSWVSELHPRRRKSVRTRRSGASSLGYRPSNDSFPPLYSLSAFQTRR